MEKDELCPICNHTREHIAHTIRCFQISLLYEEIIKAKEYFGHIKYGLEQIEPSIEQERYVRNRCNEAISFLDKADNIIKGKF